MTHRSIALFVALLAGTASAQACPWAGGTYHGNNHSVQIEFTVNQDCTQVRFQSAGSAGFQPPDTPEDFGMSPHKDGWQSDIHGVTTIFLANGKNVNFFGPGVNGRLHVSK